MSDGGGLQLLLETSDPVELAGVRMLLEGHGIEFVIQGENHAAMTGGLFGSTAVVPRILVAESDLEKAQQLLEAEPENETQPQGAASLEGALCPVHEKPAMATCGRCGTFLCVDCKALGQPPLCEDCLDREAAERRPRDLQRKNSTGVLAAVIIGAVLFGLLLKLLAR
jgi:hypothetical protein